MIFRVLLVLEGKGFERSVRFIQRNLFENRLILRNRGDVKD